MLRQKKRGNYTWAIDKGRRGGGGGPLAGEEGGKRERVGGGGGECPSQGRRRGKKRLT